MPLAVLEARLGVAGNHVNCSDFSGVGGLQLKIEDQGLSGVGVEGGIWK